MIYVTRLNHSSVVLNCNLIEHIDATPDTVIALTTGQRITVLESPTEVIERVREWHHSLLSPEHLVEPGPDSARDLCGPGLTSMSEHPGRQRGHHNGGI
jgi:flagellar protein FlbD